MPFFSVIIPLYNKEFFIKDTLSSVINQTFKDFEIIIIDDGSTDKSYDVVNSFNDDRIQIIRQKNSGLCASRNKGINHAKGKFIAFLDADDLWMVDFLETINYLIKNHPEQVVFATNVKLLKHNGFPELKAVPFETGNIKVITNFFKLLKNIMGPSSLVINKLVFENVGYFDENINYGEEDDFYIRCFSVYNLIYYKGFKTYYRIGLKNQLTAPNSNFIRKIPNYEKYLINNDNKDLQKFLDFVHFRLVVLFKMERNKDKVKFYKKKINVTTLTVVQKIKYYLPTFLFFYLKKTYLTFKRY
ncbi:glycosyltransferase family 2 protein [Seonamhaeicola sp. MEBiC1930]|uniref:glycosyltransferase family 2 protein n=1 Tax=Seonamhaeicola sp. MEBiC01930 TaxID=2976768 RepID=UPI003254BB2A